MACKYCLEFHQQLILEKTPVDQFGQLSHASLNDSSELIVVEPQVSRSCPELLSCLVQDEFI